ncbi:MAG TPA: HNH endonuclease [Terriglobales bacterium]|nr:HNH endonuclease [Terriglobales bacterium]
MPERIRGYRKGHGVAPGDTIICIVLSEPFFFAPGEEIAVPASFARSIQTGKTYDTEQADGRALYARGAGAAAAHRHRGAGAGGAPTARGGRVGAPIAMFPRLGQGGFRVSITEVYRRRCAMTGEKTLPALEAAHIRPYSGGGGHELSNGLLLRRDLHRLFDLGYLSVNPDDRRIVVSGRIKTEFDYGREYYALHGRALAPPGDALALPSAEAMRYHAEHVFRG